MEHRLTLHCVAHDARDVADHETPMRSTVRLIPILDRGMFHASLPTQIEPSLLLW